MKKALAWATLPNVTRVVDLTLKLAALVAVLAVANFFTARGNLFTVAECRAPVAPELYQGIAHAADLTPEEARVPEDALRASNEQPALPLTFGAGDSMRIGCSRDIAVVEDLRTSSGLARIYGFSKERWLSIQREGRDGQEPFRLMSKKDRERRVELLLKLYPDSSRGLATVHFVPEVAVEVAASPNLDAEQVRRVLRTIELTRSIQVLVRVENVGRGDALDVTIPAPEGFTLPDTHPLDFEMPPEPEYQSLAHVGVQPVVYASHPTVDLEPDDAVYFIFETSRYSNLRPNVEIGDFVPTADTKPSVNVGRQLSVFGLLFLIIAVPLIVRDVRSISFEDADASD